MRGICSLVLIVVTGLGVAAATADASPIIPVRSLYVVPSDRAVNPAYASAIDAALLDLQGWFAGELGGRTFQRANAGVEVLFTSHSSSYYSTTPNPFPGTEFDFWFNVLDDVSSFGVTVDDPAYRWIVYIDADPAVGQVGGAAVPGVAILPGQDLRGLIGLEPQGVPRWIGGLGHEFGHTVGLPHPADCTAIPPPSYCAALLAFGSLNYSPAFVDGSIMQFGYLAYPNTYLLPEERAFLLATPFFTAVPEPATFALTMLGIAGYSIRRLRRRR